MLLDKIEELKQYVNDETINTEGYLLINKDYTTATLKE